MADLVKSGHFFGSGMTCDLVLFVLVVKTKGHNSMIGNVIGAQNQHSLISLKMEQIFQEGHKILKHLGHWSFS